jgi:hypothetical protein
MITSLTTLVLFSKSYTLKLVDINSSLHLTSLFEFVSGQSGLQKRGKIGNLVLKKRRYARD